MTVTERVDHVSQSRAGQVSGGGVGGRLADVRGGRAGLGALATRAAFGAARLAGSAAAHTARRQSQTRAVIARLGEPHGKHSANTTGLEYMRNTTSKDAVTVSQLV